MKSLVVYYSRTGVTKRIARVIAEKLKCDIEEIIDRKDRRGAKNYFIAGKDAATKSLTEIGEITKNALSYDVVLIGTPVWAFTMTPAIRTYIAQNKPSLKKVAFFCTQGGSGDAKTFREMEAVCGKKPLTTLTVNARDMKREWYASKVDEFIKKVTS